MYSDVRDDMLKNDINEDVSVTKNKVIQKKMIPSLHGFALELGQIHCVGKSYLTCLSHVQVSK